MESLESLFENEADYLYRYAKRHFPSDDVAEDLVQETFLAAVEGLSRFKGESTARTWLTSILRHKIIDKIRKGGREILNSGDKNGDNGWSAAYFDENGAWREERGPKPVKFNSPEASYSEKQFMEILQNCLSKLPSRLRHVFLLRELDGLSPEEICNELELSPTNLRVMLHRARIQLRDCLELRWIKQDETESDVGG